MPRPAPQYGQNQLTKWHSKLPLIPKIMYINNVGETPTFHHYFFLLTMRQIEAKMCEAIRNKKDWYQSNTQVYINKPVNCAQIFLHRNQIATYDYNTKSVLLSSCGWETVTTKSRLNAILHEVKYGASVYQRNWDWFVNFRQQTTSFFDGIILHDTPQLSYS